MKQSLGYQGFYQVNIKSQFVFMVDCPLISSQNQRVLAIVHHVGQVCVGGFHSPFRIWTTLHHPWPNQPRHSGPIRGRHPLGTSSWRVPGAFLTPYSYFLSVSFSLCAHSLHSGAGRYDHGLAWRRRCPQQRSSVLSLQGTPHLMLSVPRSFSEYCSEYPGIQVSSVFRHN